MMSSIQGAGRWKFPVNLLSSLKKEQERLRLEAAKWKQELVVVVVVAAVAKGRLGYDGS